MAAPAARQHKQTTTDNATAFLISILLSWVVAAEDRMAKKNAA
jgi:hypothetical protein